MLKMWCWVSNEYAIFRISTFYAPIWQVANLTSIHRSVTF